MHTVNFFDAGAEFETPERCFIVEMLNAESNPALSVARARVRPGVSTALHKLKDVMERYLILSGQGKVEIGGQQALAVGPMDIVNIPAGITQKITNTSKDDDLIFLCLCTPRFIPQCYISLE
ncbi:MAG: cupin domain-containing protein [Proteobacteria bacterium]|nr:cupin domain-containing protein [Pseudomonadota bacterium]MBU1641114.1 cupin domain-containing protein [Pseudomonadota bacterium]